MLFIPGSLLSLGAGFVFGIWLGAIAVWCGAITGHSHFDCEFCGHLPFAWNLGQTFAFLGGRYLFREWIASYAQRFRLWRGLEIASEEEGWKIVSLLRLVPIVPYSALNYTLGLTAVSVSFLPSFHMEKRFAITDPLVCGVHGSLSSVHHSRNIPVRLPG